MGLSTKHLESPLGTLLDLRVVGKLAHSQRLDGVGIGEDTLARGYNDREASETRGKRQWFTRRPLNARTLHHVPLFLARAQMQPSDKYCKTLFSVSSAATSGNAAPALQMISQFLAVCACARNHGRQSPECARRRE